MSTNPLSRLSSRRSPLAWGLWLPLLAGFASACSGARASEKKVEAPVDTVSVQTALAALRPVAQTVTLTGTLTANRRSDVAADASGKVVSAPVERGMTVPAGAVLVHLDRRSATLAVEEAAAQVDLVTSQRHAADLECARAEKLWAANAITEAEFQRTSATCAASRAQTAAAAVRARAAGKSLGDAVVRAPFRGIVADRFVTEGEYVRPETRVVTLVEIDSLRLELSVPESAVAAIKAKGDVAFQVAAFPGETFQAKVAYVGPALRRQTRDLLVEAVVPNRDHHLLPGMFATARLTTGAETVPVIPRAAVKRDGDGDRVFVVAGGRLEERLVALGAEQPDGAVVVSGVKPGERVVARVGAGVRDGVLVR
jgi:membrane fusion protein (multidrug efflux system)